MERVLIKMKYWKIMFSMVMMLMMMLVMMILMNDN